MIAPQTTQKAKAHHLKRVLRGNGCIIREVRMNRCKVWSQIWRGYAMISIKLSRISHQGREPTSLSFSRSLGMNRTVLVQVVNRSLLPFHHNKNHQVIPVWRKSTTLRPTGLCWTDPTKWRLKWIANNSNRPEAQSNRIWLNHQCKVISLRGLWVPPTKSK